jgi:hypothetical protein
MGDKDKAIALVETILASTRAWAQENIDQRYTGTMLIEIPFVEGGVRSPSITERRTLVVRRLPD